MTMGILKKLGGFLPSVDDTIGNLHAPMPAIAAVPLAMAAPMEHQPPAPTEAPAAAEPDPRPSAVREPGRDEERERSRARDYAREWGHRPNHDRDWDWANDRRPPVRRARPRKEAIESQDVLRTKSGGVDARSLRRTGRTAMMSIKVRPELPEDMKALSYQEGITLGELMDDMWAALLQRRGQRRAKANND
jgi:hypothetical protein